VSVRIVKQGLHIKCTKWNHYLNNVRFAYLSSDPSQLHRIHMLAVKWCKNSQCSELKGRRWTLARRWIYKKWIHYQTFKSIITCAFKSLPWKFVIMQPSSSPSQTCTLHFTIIGGDDTKVSKVDQNSYQTMHNITKHLHDAPFPKKKVVVKKLWQITECWP
jgi:hypothetical protein